MVELEAFNFDMSVRFCLGVQNYKTIKMEMNVLDVFEKRMRKLGIRIELCGNYPWIYLDKVNGNRVVEKFEGNHGFTIAFLPVRPNQEMKLTNIGEIMKIVRKYR